MSDTGGKRNTSEVLPCQANWALGLSTNAVPFCLTFSPPYFFTTVKATLTRACKDTVPALETQNLSPSLWGEKEIAVLRFLAPSSLREKNPNCQQTPNQSTKWCWEVAGQQGCVCGKKDHEMAWSEKPRWQRTEDEKKRRKLEKGDACNSKGVRPGCVDSPGPQATRAGRASQWGGKKNGGWGGIRKEGFYDPTGKKEDLGKKSKSSRGPTGLGH